MENLILIPGLLCDASAWQYQSNHLRDIANIIIPELTNPNTPKAMVEAVMDVAPPKFALAGHSMGGWVALEVMRHHADRVTRLCLANTTAKQDTHAKAGARREMIELAENNQFESIIHRLLSVFVYQNEHAAEVKVMLQRNIDAFINQETAMLERYSCEGLLGNITCPTLVIHAEEDAIFSLADSKQLADNIPHAKLVTIKQCGHMSIMEAAEETTELMREWLRLSPSKP